MLERNKYRFKLGDIIKDVSGIIGTIIFYYKNIPDYGYTIKMHADDRCGHDGYPYSYTASGNQVEAYKYNNLLWITEYNATLIKSRKDFVSKILI